jgi:hypothetical protein
MSVMYITKSEQMRVLCVCFGQVRLERLGRQLAVGVALIRETQDCLNNINNSD